ncbi:LysM peptidoglycan-binding domain-containing protein [Patescibacteria group bacterium]|nr:LysM peptidoglycan-binding domain-containing protein [Patescibacteria group bacterium]MBU1563572.1 LysM peptidoglycan-binding domain-containing protein [Patescibacteria group bacterium]
MGTITRHLKPFIGCLKTSIERSNKKLLLAAVVLFGLGSILVSPVKGTEQIILQYFDNNQSNIVEQTKSFTSNQASLTANTLAALINQPESEEFYQESSLITFQENALLGQTTPITTISQEPRGEIITYTVQEGDMPSSIAASFGISLNTLLWSNDLKETSLIRPGDELTILPINGLVHRVNSGDTIGAIATKYKANTEKIIAFNDLPADGAIQINQKLIIPDGQIPVIQTVSQIVSQTYTAGPGTGKSRIFPYGQCTWYIAQKTIVPWSGHAKSWLANARAAGYKTGSAPQAGAIMVLTEGGWMGRLYGHVAYVESVNGSWVTISEMNYTGWARKSVRTLKTNDSRIRGYIY